MKTTKTALTNVPYFSSTFLAYINQDPGIRSFYNRFPDTASFADQMEEKNFSGEKRDLLVEVLHNQYASYDLQGRTGQNITKLRSPDCYTVVTGHQLNLFTGPLYVILKMITTINTCEELKKAYPDKDFVPVYWMASEDHDFEEINHFHFNGSKYEWQTDQKGAVGRFSTKDLGPLLKELSAFPAVFLKAYQQEKTLASAVRRYMHDLFGEYGLVVIDADDPSLKTSFQEVMRDDILNSDIRDQVADTSGKLEAKGYDTPVHAREINFFFLENDLRLRIERTDDGFSLVDGNRTFTEQEMAEIIEKEPQKLSPNVILRPLYEEMILPNLAYCGGPSELVYWLQLRGLFNRYDVAFPILLPRNFAMIIPRHTERKWKKTGCDLNDLFLAKHELFSRLALRESTHEVRLNGQKEAIEEAFREIRLQAEAIDPTMRQHVEAQWARTEKRLEVMEKKFIRAEKRHHSDLLRQAEDVIDQLFPGGGLQERHDNLMNFFQTDDGLITKMKRALDPFDFRFNILTYGE